METGVIFKLFAGEFKTKKDAQDFLKDIRAVCKKHDPAGEKVQFTYELEH